MCGIVGIFYRKSFKRDDVNISKSIDSMVHRGPDDKGTTKFELVSGFLEFGHTRLSIIDLSRNGRQPMQYSNERFTITFNGEIYNYKELRAELNKLGYIFETESDTEVLLACWAEWKENCLKKLIGMFAFAIYDKKYNKLFCVRDAFGIKPLYFSYSDDTFSFSSEIPSLLNLIPNKPSLNFKYIYDYLTFGDYDRDENTFYDGVFQLKPGHIMELNLSDGYKIISNKRWWWPNIEEKNNITFSQAVDELRERFLHNIRLHLRSDVSIGLALSGGLDSSAIACAVRHLYPNQEINTFSFIDDTGYKNEANWIDIINNKINAKSSSIVISSKELANDLDKMIIRQGEPFGSTSIYAQYKVFEHAKRKGIKVMLEGQGADELLAGYHGYPHARMRSLVQKKQFIKWLRFINCWKKWPDRSIMQSVQYASASLISPKKLIQLRKLLSIKRPSWINKEFFQDTNIDFKRKFPSTSKDAYGRELSSTLRDTMCGYGLNALLRHSDKNSMAHSIESRVPFLTTDLAEFLLKMPENFLMSNGGETKHIFRKAMQDIVPNSVLQRRDKIGFVTPEQKWFQELNDDVFSWMNGIEDIPFLNAKACKIKVKRSISTDRGFNWESWRIINFTRWYSLIR